MQPSHAPIAEGAEVHVPHGIEGVTATVVSRQDNGDYAVCLPDGNVQTVDGPMLERANPDAPRQA